LRRVGQVDDHPQVTAMDPRGLTVLRTLPRQAGAALTHSPLPLVPAEAAVLESLAMTAAGGAEPPDATGQEQSDDQAPVDQTERCVIRPKE